MSWFPWGRRKITAVREISVSTCDGVTVERLVFIRSDLVVLGKCYGPWYDGKTGRRLGRRDSERVNEMREAYLVFRDYHDGKKERF